MNGSPRAFVNFTQGRDEAKPASAAKRVGGTTGTARRVLMGAIQGTGDAGRAVMLMVRGVVGTMTIR